MQTKSIKPFQIIGLRIRTTNENMQAAQDIGALWGRFKGEDIFSQIPNKIEEDIYCIYTNYESDHTKPYDVVLGCKVHPDTECPENMIAHSIDGGDYAPFMAKGDLTTGIAVGEKWMEIWKTNLDRAYSSDFEIYSAKTEDLQNGEVNIFVALKG